MSGDGWMTGGFWWDHDGARVVCVVDGAEVDGVVEVDVRLDDDREERPLGRVRAADGRTLWASEITKWRLR